MTPTRSAIRRDYEARIVAELRRAGSLGRPELVRRTGVPRSSVFAVVSALVERGVLLESPQPDGVRRDRGRPGTLVSLHPGSGLVVGIDVGRPRARLAIANVAHETVATGRVALAADASLDERATQIESLIRDCCAEHDISMSSLEAIGVGVYGFLGIDHQSSQSTQRLVSHLTESFGVPVTSGNNTQFAALAEATWGAGRDVAHQMYVRWSTGVGGGFLVARQAVKGAHGAAGELGHVPVDPDGPVCDCGGRGCLEQAIGGNALLERCRSRGLEVADLDALVDAVQARMSVAVDVVREAAAQLGTVVAGAVALLDPERVIIGGELSQIGRLAIDGVQDQVDRLAVPRLNRHVDVVPADLGANDGALGAIAHVLGTRKASDG